MDDASDDIAIPSAPTDHFSVRSEVISDNLMSLSDTLKSEARETEALRAEAEASLKFVKEVINGLYFSAIILVVVAFGLWVVAFGLWVLG